VSNRLHRLLEPLERLVAGHDLDRRHVRALADRGRELLDLRVGRVQLCLQLHGHGRIGRERRVGRLAGLDARFQRLDVALDALDVRMVLAVALARFRKNGSLLLHLLRLRARPAAAQLSRPVRRDCGGRVTRRAEGAGGRSQCLL